MYILNIVLYLRLTLRHVIAKCACACACVLQNTDFDKQYSHKMTTFYFQGSLKVLKKLQRVCSGKQLASDKLLNTVFFVYILLFFVNFFNAVLNSLSSFIQESTLIE
jgi:hypothetical protein